MITGKRYEGSAVDVWSCGIILFAMVCGYLPFEDPNTYQLYQKIKSGDIVIPSDTSLHFQDLIAHLL